VNPRELLQSAQAAEREGDLEQAGALLEQAARLYEETGHPARAAQMRRHVERLGLGTEGSEGPGTHEAIAGGDSSQLHEARPVASEPVERARFEDEERRAVSSPLDTEVSDSSSGPGRTLVERAPALAEPGLEAWCSFCCRPSREVGRLVAGPAQAFICGSCTELAATLLSGKSPS
jgi:ClpX C4-type zinc finger